MADKTLPALDAVSAPVVTDIMGTRQAADTEDRRQTRAQLRQLLAGEQYDGTNAQSGAVLNVATSDTIPTLIPNKADPNSGVGSRSGDEVSLIAGGEEGLRLVELNSGVVQAPDATIGITAFSGGGQGSAVPLTTSFNVLGTVAAGGDSVALPAIYAVNSLVYIKNDGAESADVFPASGDDLGAGLDTAVALAAGESKVFISTVSNTTWTQFIVSGGGVPTTLVASDAAGPSVLDEAATSTNPTLIPNKADPDTGIGWTTTNVLSLIAGALAAVNCRFSSNGIIWQWANGGFNSNATAFATGGQTNALDLARSYTRIGTCATAGDSVKLPSPQGGMEMTIINDGAEAADVFPLEGDDLGAGTNIAERLPPGATVTYFANIAATNWTRIRDGGVARMVTHDDIANPTSSYGDGDTGHQERVDDQLSTIVAGVEAVVYTGANGGALKKPAFSSITADNVSQTQASGTPIVDSLTTLISVNAADSATMPAVFPVDTIIEINMPDIDDDDATAAVFPAVGDDLGAGVNVAITVRPHESIIFRATVANSTWVRMPRSATTVFPINGDGGMVRDITSEQDEATLCPRASQPQDGIGSGNPGEVGFVANRRAGVKFVENGGGVMEVQDDRQKAVTAFATGGQTNAVELLNTYSFVTVVGSAGDSVKLPVVFAQHAIMFVTNLDSTEAMDLFPGLGDDLGQGTNVALSVLAGNTVKFIARSSALWHQFAEV